MEHEPLTSAGVMMAQALTIYKTALSKEEFNRITEHILESRGNILEVEKPTLN